jgi:predicted enzyme related to lactoylglutathione lyase
MARVVHFEVSVDNPKRAGDFYQQVFGWQVDKWEGPADYWLVQTGTGPGIDGALTRRTHDMPEVVNTIGVASVDEAVANVTRHGGKVIKPKMPVPGVGYLAYCQDTEGNTFGVMQSDERVR